MNSDGTTSDPYARVRAQLHGNPFARIVYVARTGSTNADASRLLGSQEHYGLSIVAEYQTAGSGRKGRSWLSLPNTSLLVTTILPRTLPAAHAWIVPFWTALAVRETLLENSIEADLHWPNDVLLRGIGKVAGILCVSRVIGETAWIACGAGINVYRPSRNAIAIEPLPAYCDDVALVERTALLLGLLRRYDASLDLLDDPAGVAQRWNSAAGLPGVRYRIAPDSGEPPFEAPAVGLSNGGGLVVQRDGRLETIALADARALR